MDPVTNFETLCYLVFLYSFACSLYRCETWSFTLKNEYGLKMFENMIVRKVFGPKRDEITGEWRRLHNEELHDLYSSTNVIRVIKSRRMRLIWGRGEVHAGFWCGKPREKNDLEDLGVKVGIILKRIFKWWNEGMDCVALV